MNSLQLGKPANTSYESPTTKLNRLNYPNTQMVGLNLIHERIFYINPPSKQLVHELS